MTFVVDSVAVRAFSPADAAVLSDDELLAEQEAFASARRLVDAGAAAVAGEIAHRSRRELSYDGLAVRLGTQPPERLIQRVTGVSGSDARTLVRVGVMLANPPAHLLPVSSAVSSGTLSLDAAAAIQVGLGEPSSSVPVDVLAAAAAALVTEAPQSTPEKLAAHARFLRDSVDTTGITQREEARRERRYLTLTPLADGMTRVAGLLDPESAAIIAGAVDAVTSPRRGGPRFVDPSAPVAVEDDRTIPQIMVDALVDLVKLATVTDRSLNRSRLLGGRSASVRVHVAERDLRAGVGPAHIEGQTAAVSVETAIRIGCDSGILPISFAGGQPVNLGRTQRLHQHHQRVAIAARDGGCLIPDCPRPPAMCEVHHTNEWLRDHGETSIADGVLLCRHHHLLVHNNHWKIHRNGAHYWMTGAHGQHIDLPSKNPLALRLEWINTE